MNKILKETKSAFLRIFLQNCGNLTFLALCANSESEGGGRDYEKM